MARQQIVFIGGGNMARSLVGGLVADGYPPESIRVAEPAAEQRERLAGAFGIATTGDNEAAVADADVVVLAVKPQIMHSVAAALGPALARRRPLVVSIAAGVRERDLRRWLGYEGPIVRCMPNTPALLQSGVTGLFANEHVDEGQRDAAESILRAVGTVIWLDDEQLMDTVTAVSGGGPAYFFLFIESLEAAAIARGLPEDKARLLAIETALGAARMALESSDDPATLRANVTSKGGTTAEALAAFERAGLRETVDHAIGAAADRAAELGDQLGSE
ncbi:MAG: pyrroline-5-carboxylate reductase [Halofilum sp. (in: g-proteobacteria)]|nr:pyrroline-5-carboxylate reductase [Halofilum sp. (in: g-proteobacteria)]